MYVCEKLQSRVRYGMRYVRLRHKEPSHASFIYYSRSHAADRSTRILVLFVLSRLLPLLNARHIVLFPLPFFFFFTTHFPFRLHISRTKRARFANILAACYVGNTRGNFIGPTRSACAIFIAPPSHRPFSQLFPVKCHKAKFPDRVWSWLRATS